MKIIIVLVLSLLPLSAQAKWELQAEYGDWLYFKHNVAVTSSIDSDGNEILLIAKNRLGEVALSIHEIDAQDCKRATAPILTSAPPIRVENQWLKVISNCDQEQTLRVTAFESLKGNKFVTKLLKRANSIKLYRSSGVYWITFSAKGFTKTYNAILAGGPKNAI